jgi:hypothetical protein
MLNNKSAWELACELARSGDYANVVMIERELHRRGVLRDSSLTTQIFRRELLTRLCHAARNGEAKDVKTTGATAPAGPYFAYSPDA